MKRMIQKLLLLTAIGLGLGTLTGCVAVDPQGRGYSVAVPMSLVSNTLGEQFPVKESRAFGTVEMKDATILGQQGDNKLAIGTNFGISSMLYELGGSLKLSSGVRFDPKTKNLYLANPMVEELKFQDFSLAKMLTDDMRSALGLLIAETISKKPIYNISKAGMGSNFVRGIDIRNGQIFLTFGL